MTLPNEKVLSALKADYIVGWDNISDEEYVGASHGYDGDDCAVGTTNGAGPLNTQIFVVHPDGTVIHAVPGFWHAEDLMSQLTFAKTLNVVYTDKKLSKRAKTEKFKTMQLEESTSASEATKIRSSWQGFDAKNEMKRLKEDPKRDTFQRDAKGNLIAHKKDKDGNTIYKLKPIVQIVHERMAERPFVAFDKFDTAAYVDYGRVYYDNNKKHDGEGETFVTARSEAQKKEKAARREAMKKWIRENRAELKGLSKEERRAKFKAWWESQLAKEKVEVKA